MPGIIDTSHSQLNRQLQTCIHMDAAMQCCKQAEMSQSDYQEVIDTEQLLVPGLQDPTDDILRLVGDVPVFIRVVVNLHQMQNLLLLCPTTQLILGQLGLLQTEHYQLLRASNTTCYAESPARNTKRRLCMLSLCMLK